MGKSQRDKGYRVENELVNLLKQCGLDAHRVPLSGGVDGYAGDVKIKTDDREWIIEVKCRGNGFKTLYDWLDKTEPDALMIKADRKPYLVVMPLKEYVQMITDEKQEA